MIDNDIKGNEMENEFTTDVLGIMFGIMKILW